MKKRSFSRVPTILRVSGFPEPFLENDIPFYKRWKRSHLDVILRQDMIDLTSMTDIPGIENLTACSLIKYVHFLEDSEGQTCGLHYLRTKDGRELDFVFTLDDRISAAFEVKRSKTDLSRAFRHFAPYLKDAARVQLVAYPDREKTYPGGG